MGHLQRYAREDGTLSEDRADAVHTPQASIYEFARACSPLPPEFFDAMAVRESGRATNEQDDETRSDGTSYFVSYGLYQLSDEEFSSTNGIFGDLFDPETSTKVFAQVMEKRRDILADAAGVASSDLSYAILAVCHNQGIGAMRAIVRELGNDWELIKSSRRLGGKFRNGNWTDAYDSDEDGRRQRYGDYVASRIASGGSGNAQIEDPAYDDNVSEVDTPKPDEETASQFIDDIAIEQKSQGVSGLLDFAMLFGLLWLARSL